MSEPSRIRAFPETEPAAEMRKFAAALRQMYIALMQEGFSASEAMQICGATVAASFGGKK